MSSILQEFFHARGWVQLSLAVDWWLYGGHPFGMHLTNVFLHIINTLLVFLIARKTVRLFENHTHYTWKAGILIPAGMLSAFLFALHPIQTESVTYIISRSSLISTFAYLLTLWLEILIFSRWETGPTINFAHVFKLFSVLCVMAFGLVLGIGAKEIILSLPAAVLVYQWLFYKKKGQTGFFRDVCILLFPLVALFAYYLYMRIQAFGVILPFEDIKVRTPLVNLMSQVYVIAFYYLPRIVFPVNLNLDPQIPEIHSFLDIRFLGAACVLLLLLVMAFLTSKRKPLITFSILWLFITLSVTSSFIPLMDLAAEHRLYLPLGGLVLGFECLVLICYRRPSLVRRLLPFAYALVLALPLLTVTRNIVYTNPVTMWRDSAILSPKKFRPLRNTGAALIQSGQTEKAVQLFTSKYKGVTADRRKIRSLEDLDFTISLLVPRGMYVQKSLQKTEALVQKNPNSVPHLELLQKVYYLTGEFQKLAVVVDHTLEIHRGSLPSIIHKAFLLQMEGKVEQAIKILKRGTRWHPNEITLYKQLRTLYQSQNKATPDLDQKIQKLESFYSEYQSRFNYMQNRPNTLAD
ncbi:hypothetical protein GF373_06020 [bacterium]|nr:hypothetical protein [bacterium]